MSEKPLGWFPYIHVRMTLLLGYMIYILDSLAHVTLPSLAYPMITHTPLVASNWPINAMGDDQQPLILV